MAKVGGSDAPSSEGKLEPTISRFESLVASNKISFADLIRENSVITPANPKAIIAEIAESPLLTSFNEAGLLFFSTEYIAKAT